MRNRRRRTLLFPDNPMEAASRVGYSRLRSVGKALGPHLHFSLYICFIAVFVLSATMLIRHYAAGASDELALEKLKAVAASSTHMPETAPVASDTDQPSPTPITPVIMDRYRELYQQNDDIVGWIRIDGTKIDYPVMYTGDDFYLSHGFDKEDSRSGVPFIDKRCSVRPMGTNTIIYGHHMKNVTMFAGLAKYRKRSFYKEHPIIHLDTLYEQQEYEIIAVFESQIFRKSDTIFKHYNFIDAGSEDDFKEYINGIKALALYDTGVTASYGDTLLTLVTCAYHTENGQFVVVAKRRALSAFGP